MPRPLVPVPSEASEIVAVPDFAPALDVSMPMTRLELLLACGASRLNEPLAVTPGVALPIEALSFSEKPSFGAVLAIVSVCVATLPTRTLPRSTGFGAAALGLASRNTLPTVSITPVTPTAWLGNAVMPRPLVPAPSDANCTVTVSLTLPAAAVLRPTAMLLELLDPAARPAMLPDDVMRGSLAPPKPALSFSEKPSFGARLAIVSACETTSPTWTLPNATGATVFGCARRYAAAPGARPNVTTWLRVFSKLLTIATACPVNGASAPAVPTVTTTSRESELPVASGPQLPAVTPLPERRGSVMLPPLTVVWSAPRSAGPVVPVLAML